jgi:hypothetical protein
MQYVAMYQQRTSGYSLARMKKKPPGIQPSQGLLINRSVRSADHPEGCRLQTINSFVDRRGGVVAKFVVDADADDVVGDPAVDGSCSCDRSRTLSNPDKEA